MWKPTAFALSILATAACSKSDKKEAPAAPAKPAAGSAAPGGGTAAPTPAPVAPASPLAISDYPGEASCTGYSIARDGKPLVLPPDVLEALTCPVTAPVLTPDQAGFLYVDGTDQGTELKHWTAAHGPHRLVMFDPVVEGLSSPSWSPAGAKVAVVVKGTNYPKATRLFVLTVSAAGEVTDKVKRDVAVFAPCGSVCVPEAVRWKDEATLEVVTPGEGEPGPVELIKL